MWDRAGQPDRTRAAALDREALDAELAAMQITRLRRITARRQARADHQEARRHGLPARHRAKLARAAAGPPATWVSWVGG